MRAFVLFDWGAQVAGVKLKEGVVLCEKVLDSLGDGRYDGRHVDYVDIEWHEAHSRVHRKTSSNGEDVGIRLADEVAARGLHQGDVLYADDAKVIAVNIPPADALKVVVRADHRQEVARLCWEVGNTHTPMFRGEDELTFFVPYSEPLAQKIAALHGVEASRVTARLDFDHALSGAAGGHHHHHHDHD